MIMVCLAQNLCEERCSKEPLWGHVSPWLSMTVFKSRAVARLPSRLGSPGIPCSLVPHPRLLTSLTFHLYLPALLTVFPTPSASAAFPPPSVPASPCHRLSPTHRSTWASWGRRRCSSATWMPFSENSPHSPAPVPRGSAPLGVLYIYESGLACFGFKLVFWLSVQYSAFFLQETESGLMLKWCRLLKSCHTEPWALQGEIYCINPIKKEYIIMSGCPLLSIVRFFLKKIATV